MIDAEYHRKWYHKNKEKIRAKRRENYSKRKKNKERLIDWLETKYGVVPCMDCDGVFAWCAMDFDHRPGEVKEFKIGAIGGQKATSRVIARAEKEITKCDLVCSNCHRVRTRDRHE